MIVDEMLFPFTPFTNFLSEIDITTGCMVSLFKSSDHIPVGGEVYKAKEQFRTRGGEDTVIVIGRTDSAPYGAKCSVIGNVLIKGKNKKVTVWSNFEMMITNHVFERVL